MGKLSQLKSNLTLLNSLKKLLSYIGVMYKIQQYFCKMNYLNSIQEHGMLWLCSTAIKINTNIQTIQ